MLTFEEGLGHRTLHLLLFMVMCSVFSFLYLTNVYKAMGIKMGGLDDFTLTIIGALGGLANGSSRVVWGMLLDKYLFW